MRSARHTNERVAKEQLALFLEKVKQESDKTLAEANEALAKSAAENGGREETTPHPKQPPARRPPTAALPRVDNAISG